MANQLFPDVILFLNCLMAILHYTGGKTHCVFVPFLFDTTQCGHVPCLFCVFIAPPATCGDATLIVLSAQTCFSQHAMWPLLLYLQRDHFHSRPYPNTFHLVARL